MKKLTTVTLALTMAFSLPAWAGDAARPAPVNADLADELIASTAQAADVTSGVHVHYLLDSDGRPYIISIWSDDSDVTRMVRRMIGSTDQAWKIPEGEQLAITFYYDNIR